MKTLLIIIILGSIEAIVLLAWRWFCAWRTTTWYVDERIGDDENDGLGPERPFKTIGECLDRFDYHIPFLRVYVVEVLSDLHVPMEGRVTADWGGRLQIKGKGRMQFPMTGLQFSGKGQSTFTNLYVVNGDRFKRQIPPGTRKKASSASSAPN